MVGSKLLAGKWEDALQKRFGTIYIYIVEVTSVLIVCAAVFHIEI